VPNSAEELRHIRNAAASLTIEEIPNNLKKIRCSVELCTENGGELIDRILLYSIIFACFYYFNVKSSSALKKTF
jgi:hypothetical protein